jgi:hypothetical protein
MHEPWSIVVASNDMFLYLGNLESVWSEEFIPMVF